MVLKPRIYFLPFFWKARKTYLKYQDKIVPNFITTPDSILFKNVIAPSETTKKEQEPSPIFFLGPPFDLWVLSTSGERAKKIAESSRTNKDLLSLWMPNIAVSASFALSYSDCDSFKGK